jgi:hypothetical protein
VIGTSEKSLEPNGASTSRKMIYALPKNDINLLENMDLE